MTLESVVVQLREQIGLDPASLGPTVVATVVAARQRALGLDNLAAYAKHLKNSPQELAVLIDELIVPETWFFRGGNLFSHLAKHIQDAALTSPAGEPFRILSVPCSTGEEPYSLAIALAELHVPHQLWHLDAIDISGGHLDRARRGRYSELSFRQTDGELRDRYFKAFENAWEIDGRLRRAVHFRQGNLIAAGFLREEAPYDLIFCRNLLIYLHDEARGQVVATLDRLLSPRGLIAMGHAEPLSSIDRRFSHVGPDGCFLFCRSTLVDREEPPARHAAKLPLIASGRPSAANATSVPPPKAKQRTSLAAALTKAPSSDPLSIAKEHADAGRLDEARAACQALLSTTGPTADLYALLGAIHKARHDDAESKHCFEKALYLQPDHGESILHLMLFCEQEGAHSQAAVLRSRLRRVRGGGAS